MKTRLLLIVIVLLPILLSGQGVVQKQNSTQTSNTGYQSQTYQNGSQNTNSYQPTQTVQPTLQYTQPQNQQYTVVKQNNTQLQNGYSGVNTYQNPNNGYNSVKYQPGASEKTRGMLPLGKTGSITKNNMDQKGLRTNTGQIVERKDPVQKPNTLVNSIADSSSGHYTDVIVLQKFPLKESYVPQSPEVVYKLTPTLRLRYVSGCFNGWNDLNGFGVHIAAFVNFNYCKGVANWIRKKYHATSYIFEDQSGYPHYHLVFGRWLSFKSAEIFEGKVRREAPHAFVCLWRNDFSVLLPDFRIMQDF